MNDQANNNQSNKLDTGGSIGYNFREIEAHWQQKWIDDAVYKVPDISDKPKYYVLDMFPYPSGAGLHVGHPLGYIASDIIARYKRLKGYNVLHPMGYDSFGLPAEQYAIEHGVHPAVSTEKNINTFRKQLDNIGFSFDWSREVRTSDPKYYKWTQWIFLQLFRSWYNRKTNKTEPIETLLKAFETEGNVSHPIPNVNFQLAMGNGQSASENTFDSGKWNAFDEKTKQSILMEYRVAYCGVGEVNWCEQLGTVLANDEVVNGVSERGGYPVVKKKLRQWYLRITEFADRLLDGLKTVEFSDAMKEMQSNWIGKSSGVEIQFSILNFEFSIYAYTTRPDTFFGVDFLVLAPEHELIETIATKDQKKTVEEYISYVKSRSERERMAEKKITGVFTGVHAIHPFNGKLIPVWISEYVLAGYGTGAIMGVPSGDERDHKFAQHFTIPITNIFGDAYHGEEALTSKELVLDNSEFLNGLKAKDAIEIAINRLEELGAGKRKVNYKIRDAAFSRQRYWGEPFPIKWIDGVAYPLDESELPLELPHVESYKPGPEGEGPLANIPEWIHKDVRMNLRGSSKVSQEGGDLERAGAVAGALETNTMPGYAGSSWYFLRYMDPHNEQTFCDKHISSYWNQVDLYVGGTEHAVGHLLYSRMWTKALYDLELITFDEPFKRLLNQGMITGKSFFVRLLKFKSTTIQDKYLTKIISINSENKEEVIREVTNDDFEYIPLIHTVRLKYAHKYLDAQGRFTETGWVKFSEDNAEDHDWLTNTIDIKWDGITENGENYLDGMVIEKMSKSKFNVDNPDDIVEKYGADTFRMYEMFLGPVEMSKPWDTKGIEGVHRFLKKMWRLFYHENNLIVNDEKPSPAELRILHKTIKKIEEDTERFSFNTCISAFMVCVNELTDLKCHKKDILAPLLILLTPYAPHVSCELWELIKVSPVGGDLEGAVLDASYPKWEEKYLAETTKEYPISINGKLRTTLHIDLNASQREVEEIAITNEVVQKWLDGRPPKKIIYIKGKMINVVV